MESSGAQETFLTSLCKPVGLAVALLSDPVRKPKGTLQITRHGPGLFDRAGDCVNSLVDTHLESSSRLTDLKDEILVRESRTLGTSVGLLEVQRSANLEMEGLGEENVSSMEQGHDENCSNVAGTIPGATCAVAPSSMRVGVESQNGGPPSSSVNVQAPMHFLRGEAGPSHTPEQTTGNSIRTALGSGLTTPPETSLTTGLEQNRYPTDHVETSQGDGRGLSLAEDDDLPALLGPEDCSSSEWETEDEEPPDLVGESDSAADSDADSAMESLPGLGSDMSDSESADDTVTEGGRRGGLMASAAPRGAGNHDILQGTGGPPAMEDQANFDSEEVPDLLEAETDDDDDDHSRTPPPVFAATFRQSLRSLLSTGFQPGLAAAPTAGGGREARRRERRRRVTRVAEPEQNEGRAPRRRAARLSPASRVPNDEEGPALFLPPRRLRGVTSSAATPAVAAQTRAEDGGSPDAEGGDDDVPDLVSAEEEDEDSDDFEGYEDSLPALVGGSDGEEDEYADMPDLLPDSASSGSDGEDEDETDEERTPRARTARRGGFLPPHFNPAHFVTPMQMGLQIGNLPPILGVDFVRDRLLAFRAGDYVPDEHMDQVLAMLSASAHQHWPPPASRAAVQALEKVTMPEDPGEESCSVCRSTLEARMEVLRMPCSHLFHGDCLNPWLDVRNSCPLCRFQLPTDDADYEEMRRQGATDEGLQPA